MVSGITDERPRISFIIPAKNERDNIEETVRVVTSHQWLFPVEVIVVDNESTDDTADIARSAGAKVFIKSGGTIGEVRNYGVAKSCGSILVFIDADISLADEWFREIGSVVNNIERNPYLITGSHCIPPTDGGWLEKYWFGKASQAEQTTHLGTGHLLVSRELFSVLNGFSPGHETGEDYDFCMRAKKIGATVINNPRLKAIHRGYPKNLWQFVQREAWHGQGDTGSIAAVLSSKVAVTAVLILLFHILVVSALVFKPVSTELLLGGLTGIGGLLLLSSIYKFRHAGIFSVLINSVVFYFYYVGRLFAVLNISLGKRARAN